LLGNAGRLFNECIINPVSMSANSDKSIGLTGINHINNYFANGSSTLTYPDRGIAFKFICGKQTAGRTCKNDFFTVIGQQLCTTDGRAVSRTIGILLKITTY
jgi:hypothetical protein